MIRSGVANVSTAVEADPRTEAATGGLALTVVSHPMAQRVGEHAVLDSLARRGVAAVSRNEPEFVRYGRALGKSLDDPFISRQAIRFVLQDHGRLRVMTSRSGTRVVIGARVDEQLELTAEDLATGVPISLANRVVLLLHRFDREIGDGADLLGMVGHSAAIREVRGAIHRVLDLQVPVLIRGETGTGKELVARAIHDRGPRRDAAFVSVNLAAIPRELAAAELFGATRGAYTGATRDREGLFRAAQGGTLFLDEIGEASPEVQAMLLRVLETGEVTPVGADRPIAVQVRLIAATDAPLEDHVRRATFKAPLLHRLASYEIRIPPLRQRREDIGLLFYHFAREELATTGELDRLSPRDPYTKPWLPVAIAAQLARHDWPGNIRQLRNIARQLVIASRGEPQARLDRRLTEELRGPVIERPAGDPPGEPKPSRAVRRKPSDITERELLETLRACAWDLKATADRLRIPRPSVYALIERNPGIRTAGDLGTEEISACYRDCAGDLGAMAARLQVSRHALARRVRELGLARGPP